MSRKKRRQLLFETLESRNLLSADISLIRYFDTWNGGVVRSTDPAGITYHPPTGHLYLVDSEINELTGIFVGNNIFEISTSGDTVYREIASKNAEPTGITYNSFDGFFYVVNDDTRRLYRYNSNLNAPLASIDTRVATPNAADPEDVTSDPSTGMLYVVDGKGGGRQVLVYDSNLVFQYRFSIADRVRDGEGIALDTATQHLLIVSTPDMSVFEYTTTGTFIRSYNLGGFSPLPVAPQGLTFAPTSDPTDDPNAMSLYIVDAMVDNFADGRVFEARFTPESPGVQTSEVRIAAGSDDAEEKASGSVVLTSADLELVYDGSNQTVGLRFLGINIPRGSTIVGADIQFQVDEATSDVASLLIQGQAVDNAPTFAAVSRDVSSRARTSASTSWTPPAWPTVGIAGPDQRTPDLAPIIQQIIDRPGWREGNALAILTTGTGKRVAESYEGKSYAAPLLRIRYMVGAPPPNLAPQVDAGLDQTVAIASAVNLDGTVVDDGQPGPVTTTWSTVSGPGSVTFGNENAVDTTATFSQIGTYVLRLTANDGELTSSDDVTIQVVSSLPQSINVRIATGSDDAEEKASGTMVLTSSDLELVYDGSNQKVGLRFTRVAIPPGATINNAYIQFQVDEAMSVATSLVIQGEDVDNAATFVAVSKNISSRPRTSTSVAWTPPAWPTVGIAGPDQQTPNIAGVIQQIVNRTGWVNGNALAIIITGTGERVAESYEGKSTAAPLLHVEFVAGSSTSSSASAMSATSTLFAASSAFNTSAVTTNKSPAASVGAAQTATSKPKTSDIPSPTKVHSPRNTPRAEGESAEHATQATDLLARDSLFAQLGEDPC